MRTGIFRVRRTWLGKCILQERINSPSFIAGRVDSGVRDIYWRDVKYDKAPNSLTASSYAFDIDRKWRDIK
jgi:hypothetical protein